MFMLPDCDVGLDLQHSPFEKGEALFSVGERNAEKNTGFTDLEHPQPVDRNRFFGS